MADSKAKTESDLEKLKQLQIQVDTLEKTNAYLLDGNNSLQVELEAFRRMKAEGNIPEKEDGQAHENTVDFDRDEN